jgi:UDP-sugar pyrophosphorylase
LPAKWVEEGRRWLLLFQDTNPLPFRSVCAVLGVSAEENFALNSVTVPRFPGEAVGGIATLENEGSGESLTVNVEYNQLDPLLKTTPVGGDVADASGFSPYPGNINILVFGLNVMADRLATTGGIVPEFCNPKWADSERSKFKSPTRLECMMQDFPRLLGPNDNVGFTMLERLLCFTCVKNSLEEAAKKTPADCALSAEADIYACNARLLSLAGADVQIEDAEDVTFLGVTAKMGPRIVLQPSFGVSLEDTKTKVQGKWRISHRSVLVLDGEVAVNGLDLDGALTVTGCGQASDLVVKNAGRELVAIPVEDLAQQPPSLQIRGYKLTDGAVEVRNVANAGPLHAVAKHGPRDAPVSDVAVRYHLKSIGGSSLLLDVFDHILSCFDFLKSFLALCTPHRIRRVLQSLYQRTFALMGAHRLPSIAVVLGLSMAIKQMS